MFESTIGTLFPIDPTYLICGTALFDMMSLLEIE